MGEGENVKIFCPFTFAESYAKIAPNERKKWFTEIL